MAPLMTPLEALEKAVSVLGGQTALAEVCGGKVRQQHVYNWLNRDKRLPEKHMFKVQVATELKGDVVLAVNLCPEAFPDEMKVRRTG